MRVRRQLDPDDLARPAASEAIGERHSTRAGAQVDDDRFARRRARVKPPHFVDARPASHLGLGPRDEDPGPDLEVEMAERRPAPVMC